MPPYLRGEALSPLHTIGHIAEPYVANGHESDDKRPATEGVGGARSKTRRDVPT